MKTSKISTKFFKIIFFISIISLAVFSIFSYNVMKNIEKDALEMVSNNLNIKIRNKINNSLELGVTNAIAISHNQNLIDAFKNNNREKAYEILNRLSKQYANFSSYKKGKIHIHTKDVSSFLRSWDKEHFGDSLVEFRDTINIVKEKKQPVTDIEIGWADLVIRAIVPIFDNNEYIGSLEFIQDFDYISSSLENEEKYFFPLIDKKLLKNKFEKNVFIGDYAMVNKSYNKEFFKTLKRVNFQDLLLKGYISLDDKYFTTIPILGFNDTMIGYYVIGMDSTSLTKVIQNSQNIAYIFTALLVLMAIMIAVVLNLTIKSFIVNNLLKVSDGLSSFFDFLNQKNQNIEKIDIKSDDEIGQMAKQINSNIAFIKNLIDKQKKQNWSKDGLNGLSKDLNKKADLSDLCNASTTYLCQYLESGVGTFYLYDEEKEILELYGTYAFVNRNELSNKFKKGEGTVGQVALQKSPILLKNISRTQSLIDTGTTSEPPLNTYTFPLIYQDKLYGVMELGSTTPFSKTQTSFLDICSEYIATSVFSSIQNLKIKDLLNKSEQSNVALKKQQAKLEEANSQMQEQQAQLEEANSQMQEQQAQLEEANAQMEEQQVQLKESQKELEKQNEQLESSNRYKSEFLANMSHELRTPLNSVILLSSMLKENKKGNLSEDDIKKANIINSSGEELLRLINDVLDLSKVEAGKMELLVESFDSTLFLENIKDMFESNIEQKGLKFKTEDNFQGIISSDKDKISQIIRNFLSNAIKFTHEGSIELIFDRTKDDRLKISVKDTGIGIPKHKQELVFQAFSQADGSTSRQYGGTGLGLSITKEMAGLLNGEINLQSQENKGSTFCITIPNLKPSNKEQKENTNFEIETKIDDDKDKITNKDKPFLIIEDNLDFASTLKDVINNNGDYAYIASKGLKGIEIASQNENIQGILLDLGLPDMDGLDVLKHLKSEIKTKKIPVYIISGKDSFDKKQFDQAVGFKQKPLSNEDFKNVFEEFKKYNKEHHIQEVEKFIDNVKKSSNKNNQKNSFEQEIDLSGKKVLVADDDMRNTFVLVEILEGKNAQVLTAVNGQEALDVLEKNKDTDLVLMDIMMPVMDGFEAIEKIKSDSSLESIPVIAITAKAMKQDKQKCFEAGANDYLTKPLNLDTFLKVIQTWIK